MTTQDGRALAVLVHFGPLAPTIALATRLRRLTNLVTVVANDNANRPDALHADIGWISSETNLGYAGGALLALSNSARSEYVVILNTDLEMPRGTWDQCLRDLDDHPDVGIVGPALLHQDGTLQSGCGETRGFLRWNHADQDPGHGLVPCQWVTGAAMFVRRAQLEAIGWDTSYFLGFEDLDLCMRFTRAGFSVMCEGRTPAVHDGGAVIGSLWNYYYIRNRLWFTRRHEARWRFPFVVANAIYIACRSVLGDLRHRRSFELSRLFANGLIDGLRPSVKEPRAAELLLRPARRTR